MGEPELAPWDIEGAVKQALNRAFRAGQESMRERAARTAMELAGDIYISEDIRALETLDAPRTDLEKPTEEQG